MLSLWDFTDTLGNIQGGNGLSLLKDRRLIAAERGLGIMALLDSTEA